MKDVLGSVNFDIRLKEMQVEGVKRPKHEIRAMEPAYEAMATAVALAKDLSNNPSDEAVAIIFAALFADARLNERLTDEQARQR
jgi:hypothetical protein